MTTIVTRTGKGSPLTHVEVDTNFTNLNTAKLEAGAIPLGTAAAPSVSFLSDANTGIFSPGADQVAVATAGTGRVFIDATGRVGLGTASPDQLLHLSGSGTQTIRLENTLGTGSVNLELKLTNDTFTTGLNTTSIFYNDTAGREYIWYQNSVERVRLDTSGRLLVGTSTATANGGKLELSGGITFPATAVAASNANTLDDYEEGTWTPALGGTATYSAQRGTYTKIGKVVHFSAVLVVDTIGTGSTTQVTGLPFTSAILNDGNVYVGYFGTIATSIVHLGGDINTSAVTINFYSTTAAAVTTGASAIFGNGAQVNFSGSYYV